MRNKTSIFAISMIEPNMRDKAYQNHFKNAYINLSTKELNYEIALHYDSYPDNTTGCVEIITVPDGYLIIYPILEEYKIDFDKFKLGKYSQLSKKLKQKIAFYFGDNSKSYYATIKHPSLKTLIERDLNVKLPYDAEYLSIIDVEKETFNVK